MTNVTKSSSFVAMSLVAALMIFAFAPAAHAQDWGSGDIGCCDTGSYFDTSTPLDTGSYYDTSSPLDTGSYYDTSTPIDTGSYYDTSTPTDTGTYYDTSTPLSSDTWDTTDTYGSPVTTYDSGVGYSYNDYGGSSYTPSYSGGYYPTPSYSYSQPFAITAPRYINTPVAQPQIQTQQQNQQQSQSINLPININNTNTNVNNNTAPVTPVYQTPISYPVQYIAPQPIYYPQQQYQNVYCSITASPNNVQAGQYVYLTWSSSGATYAQLSNVGTVAPSGSWSTVANGPMNYVLTVYGPNGQQATCNTYVTVNQIQPYVSLSQIPYTGFDLGATGDAMYWAALIAFALSLGYLAIYYQGGLSFATAGIRMPKVNVPKLSLPAMPKVNMPALSKKTHVAAAPAPVVTRAAAPKFELPTSNSRHTIDSMSIDKSSGAPRIVISRA